MEWHGHVLRKKDNDWVKKCMEHEVEGPRPRGIPKRTVQRLIKDVWWTGWVWVGESFFWYRPIWVVPDKGPLNSCCCCCCACSPLLQCYQYKPHSSITERYQWQTRHAGSSADRAYLDDVVDVRLKFRGVVLQFFEPPVGTPQSIRRTQRNQLPFTLHSHMPRLL